MSGDPGKRSYDLGYKAGQIGHPEALQRADIRGVPVEWKLGFFDGEGGHDKYKGLNEHRDAQAALHARRSISHDNIERKLAQLPDKVEPVSGGKAPIITKAEARGDSRPVSFDEFQSLAAEGHKRLAVLAANSSPTTGLDRHWEALKVATHAEVVKSWGGATIDSHTGQALPQGVNKFALTVKDKGFNTISIPENASPAVFNAAMDRAKQVFGKILERQGHHLGVFHDDDHHRIDFDPVIVTARHSDVETIGAASRSIGGAYNFKDGNGYWPPHVGE